jgi:hypothetical protein
VSDSRAQPFGTAQGCFRVRFFLRGDVFEIASDTGAAVREANRTFYSPVVHGRIGA